LNAKQLDKYAEAYAKIEEDYELDSVDELKARISDELADGKITNSEKNVLFEDTKPEVIENFIEEKTDEALEAIEDIDVALDETKNGHAYQNEVVDIGDGCKVVVEFEEMAEETLLEKIGNLFTIESFASQSGSSSLWKGYGNRYFTAHAYFYYLVASAVLSLENHYNLSANGIKERYGTPYVQDSGLMNASVSTCTVADKAATKPGTDVDMLATYKVTYGYSPVIWSKTYVIASKVKYVAIDKREKEIHVTQSWTCKEK
jgi:hypothetical protein